MGRRVEIAILWRATRVTVDGLFDRNGALTGLDLIHLPAMRPMHAASDIKLVLDAIWILESMLGDRLTVPNPWDLDDLLTSQERVAAEGPMCAVVRALAQAQTEARADARVVQFSTRKKEGEPA